MLLVTALLAFTAPVRADDDVKKVLETLQGEWKIVEFVNEGQAVTKEKFKDTKVVFAGTKMTFKGDKNEEESTIALDPKATPATIDILPSKTGKSGDKGGAMKGIYKLEKDKLTICFASEDKPRPKEFKSEKNTETRVFVLERAKK